ncbi:thermonuclease family protein [Streptosporangium sp. NPDC006930]|uniref:thermonuclease family protein n=1 Tax=unclassified Streptosporangium TaxID=2632669 RepID=UPI00343E93E6
MTRGIGASLLAVVLAAPLAVAAPAEAAAVPKGAKKATVVKIVDGDTIDVRFTRTGPTVRVRLLQVDTPERGACWFTAATKRTATLLPVGKTTYLLADKEPKDRYGRSLFYAWTAGGVFVNRNLVRYGYGKAVLYKPNDKYITVMRAEQTKAKRERLRIWSGRCDTTNTPAPNPTSAPTSAPTSTPDPPLGGNDPRFPTCAAANAAGYGPYRRGTDPEYAWYQDRDGDGIVCER